MDKIRWRVILMEKISTSAVGIIGGGLSGMIAAAQLSNKGKSVTVFEKSEKLGGRASTQEIKQSLLNLGPHALYSPGEAIKILNELGVYPQSASPDIGGVVTLGDRQYKMPAGAIDLLSSRFLSPRGKLELAKILAGIKKIKTNQLNQLSLKSWVDQRISDPRAQMLFYSLCRLWTYGNAPELQTADSVLRRAQLSFEGKTLYVKGGWATIIQSLKQKALHAGVSIQSSCTVKCITPSEGRFIVTYQQDERQLEHLCDQVILTLSPQEVRKVLPESTKLPYSLTQALPISAACLDLGLRRLPKPNLHFGLGLDTPLYYSNHSHVVKLSENGTIILHIAKYLNPKGSEDPDSNKLQLEQWMDQLQPGWRKETVFSRFLPHITVAHDFPKVQAAALEVNALNIPGLMLAGDWIGSQHMLADASAFSAKQAAEQLLKG
jgi:phytoene dehydrogenase-like protein